MAIIPKINSMITKANTTTGKEDADLTTAIQSLVDGYGQGGSVEGTIDIKSEGITDVSAYANANVDIDLFLNEEGATPRTWSRPSVWDAMANGYAEEECLYMVYDTTLIPSGLAQFISVYGTTSAGTITVQSGFVDENGDFQAEDIYTMNSGTNFSQDLPESDHRYLVYKFTPTTGHIKTFMMDKPTSTASISAAEMAVNNDIFRVGQPMIEAYGNLPYLTSMYGNSTTRFWAPYYIVHQDIKNLQSLTSCAYMFKDSRMLECVEFDGINTTNVTTFSCMFYNCYNLYDADLDNIVVTTKTTTIQQMFYNCYKLTKISTENWDTSKVINFSYVFNGCYQLEELDMSNLSAEKATTVQQMFGYCTKLSTIDLSNFKPTLLNCSFANLFYNCYKVQKLDLSGWKNTGTAFNSMSQMFYGCVSLRELKLSDDIDTTNVNSLASMFQNCMSLKEIDLSFINSTAKVTAMSGMFRSCYVLEKVDLSNFNGALCTTFNYTFTQCYRLKEIILPSTNFVTAKCTNIANMFDSCLSLEQIDVSGFITTNITSMAALFSYCQKLESVGDLSNWNFDKVTTLASAFQYCLALKEMPNWNNKSFPVLTTLASAFLYCTSLEEIKLDNISIPKVTTVDKMFQNCMNLQKITAIGWNAAILTNISYLFGGCQKLTKATITNWTAPKLNNYTYTFQYCYGLRELDCNLDFTACTSTTANGTTFQNLFALQKLSSFPIFPKTHNISIGNSPLLSVDSLVVIFNALPTLTTAKTLTIGTVNKNKLTSDQLAIATGKNWTIA